VITCAPTSNGLNLSRAWCLRAVAAALPAADPLRAAFTAAGDAHAAAGLANVATGDYMGEHWLASFAVYLLGVGKRWRRRPPDRSRSRSSCRAPDHERRNPPPQSNLSRDDRRHDLSFGAAEVHAFPVGVAICLAPLLDAVLLAGACAVRCVIERRTASRHAPEMP
jgi:hypothetical protein